MAIAMKSIKPLSFRTPFQILRQGKNEYRQGMPCLYGREKRTCVFALYLGRYNTQGKRTGLPLLKHQNDASNPPFKKRHLSKKRKSSLHFTMKIHSPVWYFLLWERLSASTVAAGRLSHRGASCLETRCMGTKV